MEYLIRLSAKNPYSYPSQPFLIPQSNEVWNVYIEGNSRFVLCNGILIPSIGSLALLEALDEEPLVAQQGRKALRQISPRRRIVGVEPSSSRASSSQPGERDRCEQPLARQPRTKEPHQTRRVDDEICAIPSRPLNHPRAVGTDGHELDSILFHGWLDDDDVAKERVWYRARAKGRWTGLDVHDRLELLDERGLAKQRLEL